MMGKEKEVCDVCRENERVGVIPFNAKFPSGHYIPLLVNYAGIY